jgi:hypothetical protein
MEQKLGTWMKADISRLAAGMRFLSTEGKPKKLKKLENLKSNSLECKQTNNRMRLYGHILRMKGEFQIRFSTWE